MASDETRTEHYQRRIAEAKETLERAQKLYEATQDALLTARMDPKVSNGECSRLSMAAESAFGEVKRCKAAYDRVWDEWIKSGALPAEDRKKKGMGG
jgi:hypothetical protein